MRDKLKSLYTYTVRVELKRDTNDFSPYQGLWFVYAGSEVVGPLRTEQVGAALADLRVSDADLSRLPEDFKQEGFYLTD